MNVDIVKAIIAAGGALLGTIITVIVGPILKDYLDNRRSRRTRAQSSVPIEIMSTRWEADWIFRDGTPYTKETVNFVKWTKNSQFEGYGEVVHNGRQYKYSITGEVSPARIVVLTYKAERFPTEANIGTACLELSVSATQLQGEWIGLVAVRVDGKEHMELRSGAVHMRKIKDLTP